MPVYGPQFKEQIVKMMMPPHNQSVAQGRTYARAVGSGGQCHAHITGLRGDAVSPQILGMNKIISEDALRRALSRMTVEQSHDWLLALTANNRAALSHVRKVAEQLPASAV